MLTLTEQKPSKVNGCTEAKYLSTAKTISVNEACCVNVPLKKAYGIIHTNHELMYLLSVSQRHINANLPEN